MSEELKADKEKVKSMVLNVKNANFSKGSISHNYGKPRPKGIDKLYKCTEKYIEVIKEYKLLLERDTHKLEEAIDNLIKVDEENKKITESSFTK